VLNAQPCLPGHAYRPTPAPTGKTTTAQELAICLCRKHHERVLYVTYNKSAQSDAAERFANALGEGAAGCAQVRVRTLHSLARSMLSAEAQEDTGHDVQVMDDDFALGDRVKDICGAEVDEWLSGVTNPGQKEFARNKVRLSLPTPPAAPRLTCPELTTPWCSCVPYMRSDCVARPRAGLFRPAWRTCCSMLAHALAMKGRVLGTSSGASSRIERARRTRASSPALHPLRSPAETTPLRPL